MAIASFKRKLSAIFSADAVSYSRLMAEDEAHTVKTISTYREVMTSLIIQHRGRVVDSPGDNVLAEFSSVVDAVQCAVAVQNEIQSRNAELPVNRKMQFRIGINLGDIIDEEGRLYGDGVNVAARLEALADPGGICVSKTAFDQIETKLPLGYEYLGECSVKNIPKPVGAYRVLMQPRVTAVGKKVDEKSANLKRKALFVFAIALFALVCGTGFWQFYRWHIPKVDPASADKMAYQLPDKPSIAVLPFTNMSGDPKQEYFCDGMAEDLITDLSKISGLFVVSRNSTFAYKDKSVKIRQVAEELGVRYVLEGSVRKSKNKLRVTAQLIDATTGLHLWADRYTGAIGDVFSFQDRIGQKIISALAIKLASDEQIKLAHKDTENIEAYDLFLKGWQHYLRWTVEDLFKAIPFFKKAVQIDPNYGRAYAALAAIYWQGSIQYVGLNQFGVAQEEGLLLAREYLEKAMRNPSSLAHYLASEMNLRRYQWKESLVDAERGITLEPNNAIINLQMANVLIMADNPGKGLDYIEKAMRLNPHYPARALYLKGLAHFCMEDFETSINFLERSHRLNSEMLEPPTLLASIFAFLGRDNDAARKVNWLHSKWSYTLWLLQNHMRSYPLKNPKIAHRFAEGFLESGLSKSDSSFYYKILDENRLTEQQIKELVFDRTIIGLEGWIERSNDGTAIYRGMVTGSDRGQSWIENDLLCDQWQERYGGYKICYPVFRNSEGNLKNNNAYLYITDLDIFTFSPVK